MTRFERATTRPLAKRPENHDAKNKKSDQKDSDRTCPEHERAREETYGLVARKVRVEGSDLDVVLVLIKETHGLA